MSTNMVYDVTSFDIISSVIYECMNPILYKVMSSTLDPMTPRTTSECLQQLKGLWCDSKDTGNGNDTLE